MTEGQATGALVQVSDKLLRVLPPAFILLIIMNIIYVGVLWWTFSSNVEQRNVLLTKIIDKCLVQSQ